MSAAVRSSLSMSRLLLEEAPSVPRHTFTPVSSMRCTGASPLPSFRLLRGQCTAEAPCFCSSAMSLSSTCTQCAQMVPSSSPRRARFAIGEHFWSLRWQLAPSWLPATLFSSSDFVSCMWMCIGTWNRLHTEPTAHSDLSSYRYVECGPIAYITRSYFGPDVSVLMA